MKSKKKQALKIGIVVLEDHHVLVKRLSLQFYARGYDFDLDMV